MSNEVSGLESAQFVTTLVGEGDEPGGIRDNNQALRIVQDAGIEIALPLEFRLEVLQLRNVQHKTAILNDLPLCVADGESILQRIDLGAVFLAQNLFVVPQYASRFHCVLETLPVAARVV